MTHYYKQYDYFSVSRYYKIDNDGTVWIYWKGGGPDNSPPQWVLSEDRWGYKHPEQIYASEDTWEISEGEIMLEML